MNEVSRNKRLRGANRGQLTKLITRATDITIMDELTEEDCDSLSVTLEAIQEKMDLLKILDNEISATISEEDLEQEVIETDEYMFASRKKVSLITHKFKKLTKHQPPTSPSHEEATPPTPPPSHPRDAGESPPPSPLHVVPPLPNPVVPQASQQPATAAPTSTHCRSSYRLPKLMLSRFDGNLLNWPSFYDDFSSALDNNTALSNIEKFQFLRAQLDGEALNTIAGLQLTENNYTHAKELLIERYGQTHKIVNAYMKALWELPHPRENITSLRNFYDSLETFIRGLNSLGKEENTYGELLVPMILDKLPASTRRQIARVHGNTEWTIITLRKAIKSEIDALQAGESLMCGYNTDNNPPPPTAAFVTRTQPKTNNHKEKINKCAFCNSRQHNVFNCTGMTDPQRRHDIIKVKELCFNCFGSHKVSDCRNRNRCKKCHKKHHTTLCSQNQSQPTPQVLSTSQTPTSPTPATATDTVHFTSTDRNHGTVLLKTAKADIINGAITSHETILFDEGATKSFIKQDVVDKLNLRPVRKETINLAVFGNNSPSSQDFNIVKLNIKTQMEITYRSQQL